MTCWRQPGNAYSASLVDTASIHWEFALERGEALRWDKMQVTMKAGLSSLYYFPIKGFFPHLQPTAEF